MSKPDTIENGPPTLSWRFYAKVLSIVGFRVVGLFGILAMAVIYLPSPYYFCAVLPATLLVWLTLREGLIETLAIALILALLLFLAHSVVSDGWEEPATSTNARLPTDR